MSIDMFWLHLLVLLLVIGAAYRMHLGTMRLQSRFNLYRVRDGFVLLVATGHLEEDGPIFTHYYGRINRFLQDERPAGLDDILQMMFHKYKSQDFDFDTLLERAKKNVDKLAAAPAMQHPEVRQAVADYYRVVERLILTHSSLLRAGWILSRFVVGRAIAKFIAPVTPVEVRRGWKAVDYADKEAQAFGGDHCCA